MSLQLPADLTSTIQSFLVGGRYENEVEVVRNALASLKRDEDLAAIREGIEDMNAGRVRPWEEVKTEIQNKHGFSGE